MTVRVGNLCGFTKNSGHEVPYLLCNGTNLFEMHRVALTLLEQVVEVVVQHFKHKASLSHVFKLLKKLHQVVFVGVELTDQL